MQKHANLCNFSLKNSKNMMELQGLGKFGLQTNVNRKS